MRDLKDTVKIEKLCVQTKQPVFVTKNGYGALVVMDIQTFDRLFGESYQVRTLNESIDELESGSTVDGQSVIEEVRSKYGLNR